MKTLLLTIVLLTTKEINSAPYQIETTLPLMPDIDCSLEQLLLSSGGSKQVSVEENGLAADVVFRGLSTSVVCTAPEDLQTVPTTAMEDRENRSLDKMVEDMVQVGGGGGGGDVFTAYFELVNTYKGADLLDMWDPINYRRVNVTLTPGPQGLSRCYSNSHGVLVSTPLEYIVFCKVDRSAPLATRGRQLHLTAVATWDGYTDERLWMAFGWSSWSEWSTCSVSCSTGIQQRLRHCRLPACPGFNVEQRHCNLFSCSDAVSPLIRAHIDYFHPPRERWAQVAGRPDAFHLTPNSYIWLPSINLFEKQHGYQPLKRGEDQPLLGINNKTDVTIGEIVGEDLEEAKAIVFPREFVLFVTVRVQNNSYGTIFSLRSRRRQDTYLSLEASGSDVKVIHAAKNGTDVIRVPAKLDDGNWHQIAVSIRDDSVIDSYVDCQWSRTDILRKGSLDIPDDSDLIIGYLFEGDLEQLTIVPDPSVVSLQCTNDITPIIDPSVQDVRTVIPLTSSAPSTITTSANVNFNDLTNNDGNMESNTIDTDDM